MKQVVVRRFGGIETMDVVSVDTLRPAVGEVVIRLTSVGLNQADLMARRGEYRLSSGEPPFTPGIEGGGVITAVGEGVSDRTVGQRVTLTVGAVAKKGTYRSEFLAAAAETILVPEGVDDELLGALWLPFLTAWGALVWRQAVQPEQIVMLPAASSSVAIAASQIAKQLGCRTIGTTTSPDKVDTLQSLEAAQYDHIVVTRQSKSEKPWWRSIKQITQGRGVDVIFDPVAAGEFLNTEIRLLAPGGTIWVYGLLGTPDTVDISPLIRKDAAIRGWLLNSIVGTSAENEGYQHILKQVAAGHYTLPIAGRFPLEDVREAHTELEAGGHIGKYILQPGG
ncbi:oxidoreductase, zinc-binding dehydrogenase family [Synechococcus sp. PCC 7335]|uniref:zinc-binding dehydrogenase n=1 Tax=Synechococcus sp. (strain ATCC 29403 / PCC 7335) TaxID=91464 RepID=UPI00017EBC3A|nr:zinc-binding dehydrogenase [Synechococcus sp. PCC 7335]EDX84096.1 oxidoreductase, zinc-binding dehydrogenase family [Synechococcus sp. PCC 7335]